MFNYRIDLVEYLKTIVTEDLYDDEYQNTKSNVSLKDTFSIDFFNRNFKPGYILDLGCGCGDLKNMIPEITHGVEPNIKRLEKAESRGDIIAKEGWCENIPFEVDKFDTVVSWRTMFFIRSMMETMSEVNRVLKPGGRFIFDVKTSTNCPMSMTVDADSFVNQARTYGFQLIERRPYEAWPNHKLLMLCYEKIDEFDVRRFLLPQCKGEVYNFLPERDWYLL